MAQDKGTSARRSRHPAQKVALPHQPTLPQHPHSIFERLQTTRRARRQPRVGWQGGVSPARTCNCVPER